MLFVVATWASGRRAVIGMAAAFVGVLLIAVTVGQTSAGASGQMSAVSWHRQRAAETARSGRHAPRWSGQSVLPLPSLALSMARRPPHWGGSALRSSWAGLAAALYLGLAATTFAYALWGGLLRRYPTATVAPFALLVPFVAALSTWIIFGERFGPVRLSGMAFVLLGLVLVALPSGVGREAVEGHAL